MHDNATPSSIESDSDKEDWGGHPLFPRAETETGPDPRKFDRIQLVRYNADGSREVAPKAWKGSELHSWQQVLDEYGGEATYQLVAQCGKTHKYSAWSEKWYFSYPPRKPWGNGPVAPPVRQDVPQSAPLPPPQTTSNDALLQMNMMLMKMAFDRQAAPQPNPVELIREVAALTSGGNRGPTPFEMFKEMLPLMNSGERTSRTLMQGIDLAREIYKNAPAAAPARSESDDMTDVMNMVKLFTAVRPANPPAPAAPAQTPAPAPNPQQAIPVPPCPPPPGYGWMFTQQGWVAFHLGMTNAQFTNRPAPIPAAPQAPAAPMPQIHDEDVMLRKLLEHPEMRAKLQALLAEPAPVPPPAPPAPVPAPSATQTPSPVSAAVPAPPGPPQVSANALPDMLTAAGWSFTPSPQGPVAMHFTKPTETPMVSPAQPPPANSFEIPADVPLDDELRQMLNEPEFQKIALSLVPPEAQGMFTQLVQQNAQRLQETAEA